MRIDSNRIAAGSPPPTRAELDIVIEGIWIRLDQTAAACGEAFPLYAPAASGAWTTSEGGSWSGGFWAASWWQRARLTRSRACRERAAAITARLAGKRRIDSINRSLIFWYGAARGADACGGTAQYALARAAAHDLAASFDTTLGCVPLGSAMGAGPAGRTRIGIDSLGALIALLTFDGCPPGFASLARRHTDSLLRVLARADGAWHSVAAFGPGGWAVQGDAGDWSRGQAWAMLGLAHAAERWGGIYRDAARRACEYWLHTRSLARPPDRLGRRAAPPDPSASLVAATAMLALARSAPDAARWRHEAAWRLGALLCGPDMRIDASGAALFAGACQATHGTTLALVEAPWSSFLLLDALCELASLLHPGPTGPASTHT